MSRDIVDFRIDPCLRLFSTDISLQFSLSRDHVIGVEVVNILIMTTAMESKRLEKTAEDMDKFENQQYKISFQLNKAKTI